MGDNDHEHKHHSPQRERPQSTDVKDLTDYHGPAAASSASKAQRGKAKQDIKTRVVSTSVEGERVRVMIPIANDWGVGYGMMGYLLTQDGQRYEDFIVERVTDGMCHAHVDAELAMVQANTTVLLNPASLSGGNRDHAKPSQRERPQSTDVKDLGHHGAAKASKAQRAKQKHDIRGRVMGISVEGLNVRILIGTGSGWGVEDGMKGYLVSADGKRHESFEVVNVSERTCYAYIQTTPDMIQDRHNVVLNPS